MTRKKVKAKVKSKSSKKKRASPRKRRGGYGAGDAFGNVLDFLQSF